MEKNCGMHVFKLLASYLLILQLSPFILVPRLYRKKMSAFFMQAEEIAGMLYQ
jgi:hypothetical protein